MIFVLLCLTLLSIIISRTIHYKTLNKGLQLGFREKELFHMTQFKNYYTPTNCMAFLD